MTELAGSGEYLSNELLIIVHVSQFIGTVDFIKTTQLNAATYNALQLSWNKFRLLVINPPTASTISNTLPNSCFFHFQFSSICDCVSLLRKLWISQLGLYDLHFQNAGQLIEFVDKLDSIKDLSNLSRDKCDLVQFQFSAANSDDEKQLAVDGVTFSNPISIPGGFLRLFRRPISSLYPGRDDSLYVMGIDIESSSVWLCRVCAVSGMRRLDIKAGLMRSDVLRVPNGSKKGTWTDLCPVGVDSDCQFPPIFLVEYICN